MSESTADLDLGYVWLRRCCVVSSISSVVASALWFPAKYGGFGGALAVALSFLALSVREDLSDRVASYLKLQQRPAPHDELITRVGKLENRLEDLDGILQQKSKENRRQNIVLAQCSVLGTVFWTLGEDLAELLHHADWLRHLLHVLLPTISMRA